MGICPSGFNCGYAHGISELRTNPQSGQRVMGGGGGSVRLRPGGQGLKTVLCNNWEERGECPYGNSCNFAHGQEQLKVKPPEAMDESDEKV